MNTKIHEFKVTGEFLVVEDGRIIKVCKSEEAAKKQLPMFKIGDIVDVIGTDIRSAEISDMGRCGVNYDGDLWYELKEHPYTSYDQEEFRPALVPRND